MTDVSKDSKFLPADYVRPDKRKQFIKWKEGPNQFRILTNALLGWVLFGEDKKPVRKPFSEPFTAEEVAQIKPRPNDDGSKQIPKHFWVFLAYCYLTKSIKVVDVNQTSIMDGMEGYFANTKFGDDPTAYDFIVVRTGTTKENTTYAVQANPPEPIGKEEQAIIDEHIGKADLDALMTGGYPFEEYAFEA